MERFFTVPRSGVPQARAVMVDMEPKVRVRGLRGFSQYPVVECPRPGLLW